MINTFACLRECLFQDSLANRRKSIHAKFFGDRIWKFIKSMRWLEFIFSKSRFKKVLLLPLLIFHRLRYESISLKLGYSIPINTFEKGLCIAHAGTIIVNGNARIGMNCKIHDGVTIGSTNGSGKAPQIGNNVFIATGAKVIGDISIADDVAIGANAVVVKSINEAGTTWGGVPAKKISNNNSHMNLSNYLSFDL